MCLCTKYNKITQKDMDIIQFSTADGFALLSWTYNAHVDLEVENETSFLTNNVRVLELSIVLHSLVGRLRKFDSESV